MPAGQWSIASGGGPFACPPPAGRLKVPQKQPKRSRLWLNDGSCIRLRPERPGHVWAYDFVQDRTQDGRSFRMLTVIDEFTRQCLAIVTARKLKSDDVLHCLTELFTIHSPPEHIRSDNGSEFTAKEVRRWLGRLGVQTLFIEPGSPLSALQSNACRAMHGKTATMRASIRSCATNC